MARVDLIDYHEEKKYPSHTGAVVGILVVFGGFVAAGVYSLWSLWNQYGAQLMSWIQTIGLPQWLTDNLWMIGVAIGILLLMSLLLAFAASVLAKRLGGTLIYIGAGFMFVLTWLPLIILLAVGAVTPATLGMMWPVMIPGILTTFVMLLLFTVFRGRIRRAGEIIKLTGQVCIDEKGLFVPQLLVMIFTLVSALMFGAIIFQFTPVEVILGTMDLTLENGWPLALGMVAFMFMTIFFYYFAYGVSSGMVYIYMRGRDPSLGDGRRATMGVLGGIVALSIASVIVLIIRMIIERAGREAGPGGAVVGGAVSGIIGWVWAMVNYFTIPAMVAEQTGARAGIRRSAGLVKNNFVDVMIKETAVRWAFGVLAFIFFFGFGLVGFAVGYFYSPNDILTIILIIFAFVVFSSIPSTLVLRTFDIVYVTLLYVFIRRKEGEITEKTAIPVPMERQLDSAYDSARQSGIE